MRRAVDLFYCLDDVCCSCWSCVPVFLYSTILGSTRVVFVQHYTWVDTGGVYTALYLVDTGGVCTALYLGRHGWCLYSTMLGSTRVVFVQHYAWVDTGGVCTALYLGRHGWCLWVVGCKSCTFLS